MKTPFLGLNRYQTQEFGVPITGKDRNQHGRGADHQIEEETDILQEWEGKEKGM